MCWECKVEDCSCKKGHKHDRHHGGHDRGHHDHHDEHHRVWAQDTTESEYTVTQVDRAYSPIAARVDNDYVYAVGPKGGNVRAGKTLHLYVGRTYHFHVAHQGAGAFYFTQDPIGGSDYGQQLAPGTPQPVSEGTLSLNVTKDFAPYFYYQSTAGSCNGGLVVVHGLK